MSFTSADDSSAYSRLRDTLSNAVDQLKKRDTEFDVYTPIPFDSVLIALLDNNPSRQNFGQGASQQDESLTTTLIREIESCHESFYNDSQIGAKMISWYLWVHQTIGALLAVAKKVLPDGDRFTDLTRIGDFALDENIHIGLFTSSAVHTCHMIAMVDQLMRLDELDGHIVVFVELYILDPFIRNSDRGVAAEPAPQAKIKAPTQQSSAPTLRTLASRSDGTDLHPLRRLIVAMRIAAGVSSSNPTELIDIELVEAVLDTRTRGEEDRRVADDIYNHPERLDSHMDRFLTSAGLAAVVVTLAFVRTQPSPRGRPPQFEKVFLAPILASVSFMRVFATRVGFTYSINRQAKGTRMAVTRIASSAANRRFTEASLEISHFARATSDDIESQRKACGWRRTRHPRSANGLSFFDADAEASLVLDETPSYTDDYPDMFVRVRR